MSKKEIALHGAKERVNIRVKLPPENSMATRGGARVTPEINE